MIRGFIGWFFADSSSKATLEQSHAAGQQGGQQILSTHHGYDTANETGCLTQTKRFTIVFYFLVICFQAHSGKRKTEAAAGDDTLIPESSQAMTAG
jgi:hypothetical protein